MKFSKHIHAPIDQVFSFFDDPANTVEFSPHADRFELIEEQPDGRRTYDFWMRSDAKHWMQTVEQTLRESPHRLITRGKTWTDNRSKWLLTVTTDRRFSVDGDGTRVDATVDAQLDQPLRRPLQAVSNFLRVGATQRELQRQLDLIAERIESEHQV